MERPYTPAEIERVSIRDRLTQTGVNPAPESPFQGEVGSDRLTVDLSGAIDQVA
ncbi:MAG: hypothetical protein ACM37W_25510 [Actinomycetota bacterium]